MPNHFLVLQNQNIDPNLAKSFIHKVIVFLRITKIHAHLEIPKHACTRLNDLTAEVHIHYQDGTSLLFRAAHTGSRDNITVHTAHTTATSGAWMSTASCLLMGKFCSMRHQLILRKLLQNLSELKAVKFYNQKRITSIYKTYKRQKLCGCMYVCLFVRMFMWHLKPVTNTKRGPEITGVLRTVVQPGELSSAYTVHCQHGFGLAWNKCELFRFEPKFLFIALQNMKTWISLDNSAGQYVEYTYLYCIVHGKLALKNKHERDYYCGEPKISLSCNNFWTRHCGYFHGLYIP